MISLFLKLATAALRSHGQAKPIFFCSAAFSIPNGLNHQRRVYCPLSCFSAVSCKLCCTLYDRNQPTKFEHGKFGDSRAFTYHRDTAGTSRNERIMTVHAFTDDATTQEELNM